MRKQTVRRLFCSLLSLPILFASSSLLISDDGPSRDSKPIVVSEEAKRIHANGYIFDGHNDLPWAVRSSSSDLFEQIDIRKPQPQLHTDIDRLKAGNVGAQFWSVYVPVDTIRSGTAFQKTVDQITLVKSMIERYPDVFELALTADDVERIRKSGKIASLIGMEGGHSIENSIGKLRQLSQMGARYMTLTHTDTLDWADSATDASKSDGLSPFGEEVLLEMNRLGILVDLSHVSPRTMHRALDITKAPVIFSHSSAKAIANHPRNVPDDVLLRVKTNGGVVMINFFSGFVVPEAAAVTQEMLQVRRDIRERNANNKEQADKEYKAWQNSHPYPAGTADVVVDHIDHVVKIAGIDHVGFGSDYDGIMKTPAGIEDVSTYPVLTELLLRRGYSEADIHKIMYGNVLRVLRDCDRVQRELVNR